MKNTYPTLLIVAAVSINSVLLTASPLRAEVITLTSKAVPPALEPLAPALSALGKTVTVADDLVLVGKFSTAAARGSNLSCANLTIRPQEGPLKVNGHLWVDASSLTVDGNITVEAGILTKHLGNLQFKNLLRMGPGGIFEVMINPAKVMGGSLDCARGSNLIFKLFDQKAVTTLQAPDYCALNLSGGTTFAEGAKVTLQVLQYALPHVIAPGQYLLIQSSAITGPLPELVVKNGTEVVPSGRFSLKQDGGKMLLVVGE
jgi:hypothetical protein